MSDTLNKDVLEIRKEKIFNFFTEYKEFIGIIGLLILMIFSFNIRTSNLHLLKDVTTGLYIPGDPDAAEFFRYSKYILEHGSLMAKDMLRYFPLGYNNLDEFSFLAHFIVYLYKVMHFFNSSITLDYVDVFFPALTFSIALIPFYFLVRKLFDYRVALLSSAFLAVAPQFLYRTISGVGDKEALAIVFFFSALCFFIYSLKSKNRMSYLHAFLTGLSTALLGITWGGVNFIFVIISVTTLTKIVLNNFDKKDFYSYVIWWVTTFVLLNQLYPYYYGFGSIIIALTSQITLLALISGIIYYLINEINIFKVKEKFKLDKYPIGALSLGLTIILGLIFVIITQGSSFITDRILNTFIDLTRPFSRNRWALTVAESQQPFVNSWKGNFGSYYLYLFLISSVLLFYECFKNIKKHKIILTIVYSIFLLSFIFSRYSSDSILNGKTTFSLVLYLGSLISFILIIVCYYLYAFFKDKELYKTFSSIDNSHILILVWFLFTAVGARSAVRLVFIFVPVTAVLVSYILMRILDYGLLSTNKVKKIGSIAVVTILIFAPFVSGSLIERGKITVNTAKNTGASFDQQWQYAMSWVRENTPKDSVFAHWWDYGYWVQAFGERATISDGGNARGAINFFVGRHLLTGRDRTESLELLKAHNATHVLIVSDEIGKYTAFSSIGADENYDRFSYIPTFFINNQEIQEGRDADGKSTTSYLYRGTFVLDEDFIYNGKLFPKGSAAIAGVILITRISNETTKSADILQPQVALIYQNQRQDVPLNCLFLNGQEYEFNTQNGYNGCLRIMPVVDENGNVNPIMGGLFLSPNTKNTLFSNLYLFDKNEANSKDWLGYKKVYDDTDKGYTLAYYIKYGRLIGPLKIWQVDYSSDIKYKPEYLSTEVPNPDVEKVKDY